MKKDTLTTLGLLAATGAMPILEGSAGHHVKVPDNKPKFTEEELAFVRSLPKKQREGAVRKIQRMHFMKARGGDVAND